MRERFTSPLLAPPWVLEQRGAVVDFMFHPADRRLYYARGLGELFRPRHVFEGISLRRAGFPLTYVDYLVRSAAASASSRGTPVEAPRMPGWWSHYVTECPPPPMTPIPPR